MGRSTGFAFSFLLAFALLLAGLSPRPARACGGLFCNSSMPVNQAAERIIFSENGDGTVTAMIEIQYQGPAEQFSWVLPVPGIPDVDVSSLAAFDRLDGATNPIYQLTTNFACDSGLQGSVARGSSGPSSAGDFGADEGVTVLASGSVGPFDFKVISVDDALADPADIALMWLEDNGYDVTALGPEVLRPYLEERLNLLAFKLSKENDAGSIRPVVISYEAEQPFIPIRPTAVAANDDMGVKVFVVSGERAIPQNYKALELNEALIDWFNPNDTYNDVVSAAADEAAGQGFVTEFAGPSADFEQLIVAEWERSEWMRISSQSYARGVDLMVDVRDTFGAWDGFEDALKKAVMLPAGLSLQSLLDCPNCYADDPELVLEPATLLQSVFELVIQPMFRTEELLQSRPYLTRLYTTMSADEMTLDPAFDFNPDLDDVSNMHTAERTIECDDSWSVELPQGDIVYGSEPNVWPMSLATSEQPAARRIMQLGTSGMGEVLKDNSERIAKLIVAGDNGSGGVVRLADGGLAPAEGGDDGCGCSVPGGGVRSSSPAALLGASLLMLVLVRRRMR
ncbi:MAG: DUF2330 domain-containing protein [Myxococcales bacterium]|nr:DUF2330 domain-containing protein [Myxococcales bacterium]